MVTYFCYRCKKELKILFPVGREESCPFCCADLHCCFNCHFYDSSSYNECRESNADRVLEKEKGNFCDYFSFTEGEKSILSNPQDLARAKLEALFKKK